MYIKIFLQQINIKNKKMDKLDSESWETYAFKNKLYKIVYNEKIIKDVNFPDPLIITARSTNRHYYRECVSGRPEYPGGFLDFIMHEIYELRDKYKLGWYYVTISKSDQMTDERAEDMRRQAWLFKEMAYWESVHSKKIKLDIISKTPKERVEEQKEKDKSRYTELKKILGESHQEELNEFIEISVRLYYHLANEQTAAITKKRVEKFLILQTKMQAIQALEEKLQQLKSELDM